MGCCWGLLIQDLHLTHTTVLPGWHYTHYSDKMVSPYDEEIFEQAEK
jgi:hypothetical protein